ncbi:MAG TPA: hypothetical protein PLF13_09955 [candidate division Zixibacteria bacterium]|nr:hypothetical protein [candidate division Zixibacteria bacterium]
MMKESNNKTIDRWVIIGLSALSLYYVLPFLLHLTNWGGRDWDLFTTIAAVPIDTVVRYGQFPYWNPYLAGGNILFHHPEVAFLTPFTLLYWIFGAVVGLKLQVLFCYFLGFYGSYRFARYFDLSRAASLLAAVGYFGSVHFALHFAEGHMPFTHFCFMPWFLYFVLNGERSLRYLIGAALSLALMALGNGGAIPLLYTMTFGGLLVLLLSLRDNSFRPLLNFVIGTVAGLAMAGVKFVPMVIYLVQNKWEGSPDEFVPLSALGSIFCGYDHSLFARHFDGQVWAWHEYGAYLSPLLLLLALWALIKRFRQHWPWLILLVFFLLLGLGNFGALSPWAILSKFPGFASARCTGRSFQFVVLAVSILGAFGFDSLRELFSRKLKPALSRYILWGLVAIVAVTNMVLAWPIMSSAHPFPSPEVTRDNEFRQVITEKPQAYQNFLENHGSLISPWLSATFPSRGLVDSANNVHTEYLLSGNLNLYSREYTPNRIAYEFYGLTTGELVIGMGYDPGWSITGSSMIKPQAGLISFPFIRGKKDVVLTYRTPYIGLGWIVSAVGLLLLGLLWWFSHREVSGLLKKHGR